MIRIILLGRTGNNLFQYALGRVLSEKHGVPLVLGGQWYNGRGWAEVSQFLRLPIKGKVIRQWSLGARACLKMTGKHPWEFLSIPVFEEADGFRPFNSAVLSAPASCVLKGYFQSPRYFESIEHELRMELRGLLGLGGKRESKRDENRPVAAVHVRRGDYLQHPDLQTCDSDYYFRAMEILRGKVPGVVFKIYSDDPVWCREHFRESDVRVVSEPGGAVSPLGDLVEMSRAEHHITANSTYSWWAAWLGKKTGQLVILPREWSKIAREGGLQRCLDGWTLI